MRNDIFTTAHLRGGRFRKAEQAFEKSANDYIHAIRLGMEGLLHPISAFTRKKSGMIDSERIKNVVNVMLSKRDDFKDENERKFYASYMYCSMALCSLRFRYTSPEDPEHSYEFPNVSLCKTPDFRFLVGESEIVRGSSPESDGDDELGMDEYGGLVSGFTMLYRLLSDQEIRLKTVYEPIEESLSKRELAEIGEEIANLPEEDKEWYYSEGDFEENDSFSEKETDEEVIEEENLMEASRIKAIYPGYNDFLKQLERFRDLFDACAAESFHDNIRDMVSRFLAEGGYTVYNNDDVLPELMVLLKKMKKLIDVTVYPDRTKS